jgi:hypothetical protein
VPLDLREREGEDEEGEHREKQNPTRRGEAPGQAEENAVGRLEEAFETLLLALDRLPILGDELSLGRLPFRE